MTNLDHHPVIGFFSAHHGKVRFLIASLTVGLAIYAWTRFPMLDSKYNVTGDVSQHLIWLNDPSGYSAFDESISFSRDCIVPRGYLFLNTLAGKFFEPRNALLFVDLVLCSILFVIIFLTVSRLSGRSWLGLLLIFVLFHVSVTFADIGVPRSFAILFLAICFAAEVGIGRRYLMWSAGILLSSLFYPPCTLILCLSFVILHSLQWMQTGRFPWPGTGAASLLAVAVATAALVSVQSTRRITESPIGGPLVDRSFILKDPHNSKQGRVNLRRFVLEPVKTYLFSTRTEVKRVLHLRNSDSVIPAIVAFGIGCLILWACFRRLKGAEMALSVYLSGILLYFLAVALMFRLYAPDRYVIYTLIPSCLMLFVSMSVPGAGLSVSEGRVRKSLSAFLVGCTALFLRPSGSANFSNHAAVYENVRLHVAPGQMIATNNLKIGDMIPWFTGRSVFVNHEMLHTVYYLRQIELQDRNMSAWQRIFSLRSMDSLQNHLRENHIDGLLLMEPYHALVDTAFIPAPHGRSWNEDNALRSFVDERLPVVEFESSGRRFRFYDLKRWE